MLKKIQKIIRFLFIYGITRTLIKAVGRYSQKSILKWPYLKVNRSIGFIGCGQFQFSTINYYLSTDLVNKGLFCYDVDIQNAEKFSKFYSVEIYKNIFTQKFNDQLNLLYIASNHFTHAEYSIFFLNKGVNVYSEKPISVTFEQFDSLLNAINNSDAKFFSGYNRPYSAAVQEIKKHFINLGQLSGRFTIGCFISAHHLPNDHWYRNPEEGTRICGNVGHWLDLMIHMLNWRGIIPVNFLVQIAYSDLHEPDDNISISITTNYGDLTTIIITARSEPFEGINETINFQYDTIIAKIDDFRSLTIWNKEELIKKKYRPKDVGHRRSVMQPFMSDNRDIKEVIASTELMLHITDMVRNLETKKAITLTRTL